MNNILTKARELGEAIVESEEFKTLKAAEEAQENDEGAMALLKSYNDERKALAEEISKGVPEERMAEIRKILEDRFEEVMSNPVIAEYSEAQQTFESIVSQMNAILTYYLTGEISASCGGNCAGCAGGCGQ